MEADAASKMEYSDETPCLPVSTRVYCMPDVRNKALDDSFGTLVKTMKLKGGKSMKVQKRASPLKLLSLISAALVCGFALEFAADKIQTNNTCSPLIAENKDLAEKVDSLSMDVRERMVTMSGLLAREAEVNAKLREELDRTKRMLKFAQGTTEVLTDTEEDAKGVEAMKVEPSNQTWFQKRLEYGRFKIWQVRYMMSEHIRSVRLSLPQWLPITQRLLKWEEAVAGPIE